MVVEGESVRGLGGGEDLNPNTQKTEQNKNLRTCSLGKIELGGKTSEKGRQIEAEKNVWHKKKKREKKKKK